MKIYRADVLNSQDGWTVSYHPKRKDAQQEVDSALRLDEANTSGHVTEINFSPTKFAIVNMLNNHTPNHDNG